MSFIQNFVGFCRKSSLAKLGKSDTMNMFVSHTGTNEQTFNTILRPMPGYENALAVGYTLTGNPNGLFRVSKGFNNSPVIYGVWGKKLYALEETNNGIIPHLIGEMSQDSKCTFCETSGYGEAHPHLVICDGKNIYCTDIAVSFGDQASYFSSNSIPLPNKYPNDENSTTIVPSWIAYLYGYLIVGDEGTDIFYRSYQYPFERQDNKYDLFEVEETGGAGHFAMAEWQPDKTVIGGSNGSRLFIMGDTSFQIFVWQDSVTEPFSSPDTASKKIGISNKDSFAIYADSVFWLGSADHGSGIVYMMSSDGNPQRISTDSIEEILAQQTNNFVRAHCLRYRSHIFYILSFLDSGTTLAYDVGEGDWVRLSSRLNDADSYYRYFDAKVTNSGKTLTQATNGLAIISEDKWNEHDGTPITRMRVGGMLSSDNRPFKVNRLQLITNNGEYPLTSDEVNFNLQICRDGATFEPETIEYLGDNGEYDYDPVFKHLGKAKYFTIKVSTSSNIPFALYGIDVQAISCRQ